MLRNLHLDYNIAIWVQIISLNDQCPNYVLGVSTFTEISANGKIYMMRGGSIIQTPNI